MGREVEARLSAVGPDRSLWPAAAREEAERLDAKAAGLTALMAGLQAQLEEAAARGRQDARKQVQSWSGICNLGQGEGAALMAGLQTQLEDAARTAGRTLGNR